MTTARGVLLSAVLIALATLGGAWWTSERGVRADRYQLVNVGGGVAMRLDRESGDLISCQFGACRPLAAGANIVSTKQQASTVPPPPDGYHLDK